MVSKKFLSACILLLLVISIPLTQLINKRVILQNQAQERVEGVTKIISGKYISGEVIVKFKQPIKIVSDSNAPGFQTKTTTLEKETVSFDKLDKNSIPKVLPALNTKYNIKKIEKVIKESQTPQQEFNRLKQKYKDEIVTNQRTIDEQIILKNDFTRIYKISFDSKASVDEVIRELLTDSNVEYAEPNYAIPKSFIPNDPFYPVTQAAENQWGLENPGRPNYSLSYTVDSDIDASTAWDIQRGKPSIIVAVIDDGIYYKHSDLGGGFGPSYKVVGGYDYMNNDADPGDVVDGHGTHIAGVIAATLSNGVGISGICPGCKLMALKVCGEVYCDLSFGIDAIYYAVNHGARVINLSWGWRGSTSPTLQAAIDYAFSNGVVVVAAAGNNASSEKNYPAAMNHVISVTATTATDKKNDPANFDDGTGWVDIAAPGDSILSTYSPTTMRCLPHESKTQGYAYCSGTSMAAPFVAGVAGLLLSQNPSWTPDMVLQQIKSTADSIDSKNPGFEHKLGAGRINAQKALSLGVFNSLSPINNIAVGLTGVKLSWSSAANATSYVWDINRGFKVHFKTGTVTSTSTTVSLLPGQYRWLVTAKNLVQSKSTGYAEFKIPFSKIQPLSNTQITYGATQTFQWTPLLPTDMNGMYFVIYNSTNPSTPIYFKQIPLTSTDYINGKTTVLLGSATNAGFVKGKSYTWQLIMSFAGASTEHRPPLDSTSTPQSFSLK